MILLSILLPIISGAALPFMKIKDRKSKMSCMLAVYGAVFFISLFSTEYEALSIPLIPDKIALALNADRLGGLFGIVISFAWLFVGMFAVKYLEHEENEDRFIAFQSLSLGAMMGVCYAENLITMYLFFELATLLSMPLVLHEGDEKSTQAAMKYLFYSIAGAMAGLFFIFVVYNYTNDASFILGGNLSAEKTEAGKNLLLFASFMAVVGFGTKAGMYPMHGWLPTAHPVAPAPASALLSGIIAKAGIIAVIRCVYYTVGCDVLRGTWVQYAWIILGTITVLMGSMMAFKENVLKKRLAYSTVSNISYIMLSLSVLSPAGLLGGIMHLIAHALAKCTLFMGAGSIIFYTHKTNVSDLGKIGKSLPYTTVFFGISALSLIGIPPLAGFLSKWYISSAALSSGMGIWGVMIPVTLIISAILTAGYLLPIVIDGFFGKKEEEKDSSDRHASKKSNKNTKNTQKPAESPLMTVAMGVLCTATVLCGIYGAKIASYIMEILGM